MGHILGKKKFNIMLHVSRCSFRISNDSQVRILFKKSKKDEFIIDNQSNYYSKYEFCMWLKITYPGVYPIIFFWF